MQLALPSDETAVISEWKFFPILSPTVIQKRGNNAQNKSTLDARNGKKKSCAHIPTVYYAAAILVKLNSYCPSFMHLPTVTLSAVDYFFLSATVNRKLTLNTSVFVG